MSMPQNQRRRALQEIRAHEQGGRYRASPADISRQQARREIERREMERQARQ